MIKKFFSKFYFFFLPGICLSNFLSAQQNIKTERPISSFHTLKIEGKISVQLTTPKDDKIKLDLTGIPVEKVINSIDNGILTIKTKDARRNPQVKVSLGVDSLKAIKLSGAAQLMATSSLTVSALEVSLLDKSSAQLNVNTQQLKVNLAGGNLEISGKTDQFDLHIFKGGDSSKLKKENLNYPEQHFKVKVNQEVSLK